MKLQKRVVNGKLLGSVFENEHVLFFFGTRHTTFADLALHFSDLEFCSQQQVHGRNIVEANPQAHWEADAHYTQVAGRALVVQTADCVPVLLASPHMVCAVHSGWKGAALNIVSIPSEVLVFHPPEWAAIGPHILRSSFEIGKDVAQNLMRASPPPAGSEGLCWPHADANKCYFDLTELIRRQLSSAYGRTLTVFEFLEDTNTNPEFHSFRRDRDQAGRNLSFVVLKR